MIKSVTHKVTEECAGNKYVAPSYYADNQFPPALRTLEGKKAPLTGLLTWIHVQDSLNL